MIELHSMAKLVAALNEIDTRLRMLHGIGLNESVVLSSLGRSIVSPTEISKASGISPSNLSRLLKGLEKRCLVERKIDDFDKRRLNFALSPSGHTLLEAVENSEILIPRSVAEACKAIEHE